MLFIEYRSFLSRRWVTACFGGAALIFIFIRVPFDPFLCAQVISVGLFLLFYSLGSQIMKLKKVTPFFQYTGKISYAIFLLQHVVMGQVLGLFSKYKLTVLQESCILVATFLLIYLFSDISVRLNQLMLNSKWFVTLQNFILNAPNFRKVCSHSDEDQKNSR